MRDTIQGPSGDSSRHLPLEELEQGLKALEPPKDVGAVAFVDARRADGYRRTPNRAVLSPEGGLPGDAWVVNTPHRTDYQITWIRVHGARLLAEGQLLSLFGDNLLVDLDLSLPSKRCEPCPF